MVAMLDKPGLTLAILFGAAVFIFGGAPYLALMLFFLILAVFVTKYGYYEKKEMGIYEHDRSWENVLSNGLVPAACAALSPFVGPMPYIASISAVTADKFASELGVLSGEPISLDGFRRVKPGTSGAVSILGFIMSLCGGALIGISSVFLFGLTPTAALLVALAGFAGGAIDTLFGVLEERGLGTKGTTNIICAIAGAIMGLYIM
ncbi:MAG TPA: DUF92 domain-containing protein [Candidatus Bilamarchaeaceae archaeon]|nr:DUF92 domain-containing protein [Candidatus Bilamarchaeaceae archaeon]